MVGRALFALLLLFALTAMGCDSPTPEADDQAMETTDDEAAADEAEEATADSDDDDQAADQAPAAVDPADYHPAMLDPAQATERAPDQFQVLMETTQGEFTITVNREWSPNGADRFYNLVKIGYFQDIAFFRVIDHFMAQFGIHGDPDVNTVWQNASIPDDEVQETNTRGRVSFAMRGPNTRSTQLFINFGDNSNLDGMNFSPIGEVTDGMDVVDRLHSGYGEGAPRGRGPSQPRIQGEGNAYLRAEFENLDYLQRATLVEN